MVCRAGATVHTQGGALTTPILDTPASRAALLATIENEETRKSVSELLDDGRAEIVLINGVPGVRATTVQ